MTNWSPFLSDEMDAWFSGPWPDQQPQTHPLPPHPALQSSHPSTPSLAPFLPPLLNSLTSFHSSLGSPRPSLGFHSPFGHPAPAPAATPTRALASGFGGQSPFTASALSTSSQLARRRRRDGPTLALSQHPSTGPYRPTRPTDNVPTRTATTTNSSAATATSPQNSSQQQTRLSPLSHPSANPAPQNLHQPLTTPLHDSPNVDPRQARLREPNNDDFLDALATGDFSSPSLPPYSPQSPPQRRPQYDQLFNHSAQRQRPGFSSFFSPAHRLPDPETGLFKVEDQGNGDHDLDDKGTVGSLHSEMPATRKRTRAAAASPDDHEDGPSASKRPRTAAAHRAATPGRSRNTPRPATSRNYAPVQAAVTVESDDNETNSLFDEDGGSGGVALFDLTKSDDGVPKELFQPVKDSSIKLSTFECVICMDSATNLTVTCCGHMFCAQCLHQAMHTELTKKVCPMCRQRLDKPTPKSKPPAKAFFHLELKLRPSKKNGKQPARR